MQTKQMWARPLRLGLVLGAMVLAGCQSSQYLPVQGPEDNQVVWINLDHDVAFAGEQADLSALERRRLDDFLAQVAATATDSLIVDPGAGDDAVTRARALAVIDHLRARVPTARPQVRRIGLDGGRDLQVVVGRYLVVPPQCPNWSKPSNSDPRNLRAGNLGCSVTANLGLMVADPGDLVRGRRQTPALGAHGVAAVERYLNDEVKELELDETSELGE